MTQNIEQRTEAAVSKYEGAAGKAEQFAETDSTVSTAAGLRKSFPKLSREIEKDALESLRLGAANHQGIYAVGATYDKPNWTYTYNGQQWGLSSEFDLSILPYETTFADPNNDQNLAVRGEASQEYVIEKLKDAVAKIDNVSDINTTDFYVDMVILDSSSKKVFKVEPEADGVESYQTNNDFWANLIYDPNFDVLKISRDGGYSKLIKELAGEVSGIPFIKKNNSDQFEVFIPYFKKGRYLSYRFDRGESTFGAEPDDFAQAYSRPWIQTTVSDYLVESLTNIGCSEYSDASPTPVETSLGLYVSGTGGYFEFSGISASRLSIVYREASNAGIFRVTTINGSADLINLSPSEFDAYATSSGNTVTVDIADNLPDTPLTVRFEVIGQNASSSGDRIYLLKGDESPNAAAVQTYNTFDGQSDPSTILVDVLKLSTSAVDKAIAFRPLANELAPTPFIGSVHGYENVTENIFYLDSEVFDFDSELDDSFTLFSNSISLLMRTDIYHPDELITRSAHTTLRVSIGVKSGYTCSHVWDWDSDVHVTNGYTAMWTAFGGNIGGEGGLLNGWCNKAAFRGYGTYTMENGDQTPSGNHITDEVVLFGSPYDASEPNRNEESGLTCSTFQISDVNRVFNNFDNPVSRIDGVWVNDRSNLKKIYAQPFRAKGETLAGERFSASFTANFYKIPECYNLLLEF